MATGKFLTGAFQLGAQIFDRMDAVVEISTEDDQNFRKNLVTVLAEERLALAVEQKGDEYKFIMYEKARVNVAKIPELLAKYKGELTFKTDAENPYFIYCKLRKNKKEKAEQILENAGKIVEDIQGLVEE